MGSIFGLFFLGNIITNGTLNINVLPTAIAAEKEASVTSVTQFDKQEILWLARGIYSETKNKEEMRLIAWAIRNRAETKYRGTTYQEVLLSERQFSGLHISSPEYRNNRFLNYNDTKNEDWLLALSVANEVYTANSSLRPFPETVRHFYSPLQAKNAPAWTREEIPYLSTAYLQTKPYFVFYNAIK
jgi:hypothetical protein